MKIEIYADVACPFCYLGHQRFGQALSQLGDTSKIEVIHRPFQLSPTDAPTPTPLNEAMSARFGRAQFQQMAAQLLNVGRGDGIDFRLDRAQSVNTLQAHRLLAYAADKYGLETQWKVRTLLFAAYFTQGRNVGDRQELAKLGAEAGMDAQQTAEHLATDQGVEALRGEIQRARTVTTSVPTVVAPSVRLSGAQTTAAYLDLLKNLRANAPDGDVCAPDPSLEGRHPSTGPRRRRLSSRSRRGLQALSRSRRGRWHWPPPALTPRGAVRSHDVSARAEIILRAPWSELPYRGRR